MWRKISIEVSTEKEALAIETALKEPDVKAFAVIVGTLLPFSDRAQKRMLEFVKDSVAERNLR